MCCLLTLLAFLGPRAALAAWWIVDMTRFNMVYNTFIFPLLGFLFLPFTTLMYTLVWQPLVGVTGFGWVWVGIAAILDIASYSGSAYGNRNRFPMYGRPGVPADPVDPYQYR